MLSAGTWMEHTHQSYVFAQAGVEYEDVRLPGGEEWNKLKPS